MRILNLADLSASDIKYEVSNFPDGQQSVKLVDFEIEEENEAIGVSTRLRSFGDLELLLCATQALRSNWVRDVRLYVSYFLGARSDRKFSTGDCNYLKDVICPIINSQNYSVVYVVDPHSDVLEACINNMLKVTMADMADSVMELIPVTGDYAIVSPDAGALKKVYDIASAIGYERDVIVASKHRDVKTGKITGTSVPLTEQHATCDFVIFDDICDGGRTFVEIAKKIREQGATGKIHLVVTHGIFSAGLAPLAEHFDSVTCTNSFTESSTDYDTYPEHKILKQLKVI